MKLFFLFIINLIHCDLIRELDHLIRINEKDLLLKNKIADGTFGEVFNGLLISKIDNKKITVAIKVSKSFGFSMSLKNSKTILFELKLRN